MSQVTLTGQSHLMLILLTPYGECRFLPANTSKKSAKWILLYSVLCTQKPRSLTMLNHTSHIPNFHQLRTMTLRGHIDSVPWLYDITSTPYHEWTHSHQLRTMNSHSLLTPSSHFHSLNQMIFWPNCVQRQRQPGAVGPLADMLCEVRCGGGGGGGRVQRHKETGVPVCRLAQLAGRWGQIN
jgi:hypothetical protein